MLDRNCYGYIHIGLLISLLANIKKENTKEFAEKHLDLLDSELKKVGFEVSQAYMSGVKYKKTIKKIKDLKSTEGSNISPPIGQEIAEELSGLFDIIENIVFSEALTKKVYTIPSRRFNTEILLNSPEKLFASGCFEKFSDIAKLDIRSASKCILFGEATAASFHILRATEAVLKQYYFHHRRQKRLAKPMWGNMVDQLKAKRRNKPSASLISALDVIRASYRNPTQHPEAIYTIDSAQDLFGVCLDAIGKMALEL